MIESWLPQAQTQQEGAPGVQTGLPHAGPSRPLYEWVGLLLLVAGIVLVGIAQDAMATTEVGQSNGVVAVDVDVAAQVGRQPGHVGIQRWIAGGA